MKSHCYAKAALLSAKTHFKVIQGEGLNEISEEVMEILNTLKELQIRKSVSLEPIHLEAALEYAAIRSSLAPKEQEDERYYFLLNRMQEDFTSFENHHTREYLHAIEKNPEKRALFACYMTFIDAEKFRIEARQLDKEERLGEMEEQNENALALYSEIKENPLAPDLLLDRIAKSILKVNALTSY